MKKIFLQDNCFAHCIYSNNPLPPVQFSEDIEWDRSGKFSDEDLVIYTDSQIPFARNNSKKNIAWLIEQYELQPNIYNFVLNNHEKFFKIFTCDKNLLHLENTQLIPYGGCWIKKEDQKIYNKSKNLSIVASSKTSLAGHRLRHSVIASHKNEMDLFGNGYNYIESKLTSLKDYRFQIVIENVRKDFWFTEKLIDCFVTGTVPVYHGCPSIGDFFNTEGIIQFEDITTLNKMIKVLNDNLYMSKIEAIEENFTIAKKYLLAENQIFKYFNNEQ